MILSDRACNPGLFGHAGEATNPTFDKTSIIGLVIWILCILYTSLRSASKVAEVAIPDPEKQGNGIWLECVALLRINYRFLSKSAFIR